CRLGLGQGFRQGNDTNLFTTCTDSAHFFCFDLIVDPRLLGITFIRGSVISFDSCISSSLMETSQDDRRPLRATSAASRSTKASRLITPRSFPSLVRTATD